MKKILVVSYHFPPEEGSCSEKNQRIVQCLHDAGYEIVVLTKKGCCEFNIDKVNIIRTRYNGVFHRKATTGSCGPTKVSKWSVYKRIISNSIIPDAVIDWFPHVRKAYYENQCVMDSCDIILSISSPYSAHIASFWLSQKTHIPFIMCYGDPWLYENKRKKSKLRYLIEKKIEGFLIKKSSRILLITEWNKNKYKELYSVNPDKILTYHIGFDKRDSLDITHKINYPLKIVYGGSLDPVHRNPEPFFKAMRMISGIETVIYCSDNQNLPNMITKYGLERKISLNGLISSKDFNTQMYNNDILLLFGNKTPFQVPGKVFTYISTGRFILYLKNNDFKDDGTEAVLKEYGRAIIVKNTEEDIKNCLQNINSYLNTSISSRLENFEFHTTMSPIVTAVKEVLSCKYE